MKSTGVFLLWLYSLLGLIWIVSSEKVQGTPDSDAEECINPAGKFGKCIPLLKCKQLFGILQERIVRPESIKFLQRATCNFRGEEPWVCCVHKDESHNVMTTESPKIENPSTVVSSIKGSQTSSPTTNSEVDKGKSENSNSTVVNKLAERLDKHPNFKLLPNLKVCGTSLSTDRIIGGTDAGLGTYPWIALLAYKDPNGPNVFACGGTLISSRYVLTASHCVAKLPGGFKLDSVRLGEYDQTKDPDCQNGLCAPKVQDIPVEEVIIHEKYDETGRTENDISLIRLSRDVSFGAFLTPVCLPRGKILRYDLENSNLTMVAGFGKTHWNAEKGSNILQHVRVPIVSLKACNDFYSRLKTGEIDDTRFCAGGVEGKDSCQGDSGGPLMSMIFNEKLVQVQAVQFGVVSLGPSRCGSANPALYTRVTSYMPWILDHMKP